MGDDEQGQVSEGPSGRISATDEVGRGGADAVPDTPDALPREENRPTRLDQTEERDETTDRQRDDDRRAF